MSIAFLAVIAALLYLAAAGLQLVSSLQHNGNLSRSLIIMAVFALGCHAFLTWHNVYGHNGVNFGFFRILSLIFLGINCACLLALTRRPLQNLLVFLYPLSAVAVLISTLGPETAAREHRVPLGVAAHIGSSVLAYSILTLAAIQAALLAAQDAQLKRRQMGGLLSVLPPLQLMESMLFELIWVGFIALTLSIGTGVVFMEDIFAQHLVHKTVLSIAAWVLFAVLLWGRHWLGWRSQTAVRLTVSGFTVLMLAFLGSKLVLELVLERS
ncbi:cytochrome C assembly family protein [Congregibacter sp.]|uniref:cytochrome C assembly family protein n=1 Tax=Congregibacter sp. TaxID=2744308 RepID=UPI003F6C6465